MGRHACLPPYPSIDHERVLEILLVVGKAPSGRKMLLWVIH